MRLLGFAFLFVCGFAYSQDVVWNQEPILLEPLQFTDNLNMGLTGKYTLPEEPLTFDNFDAWIDREKMQHFTPSDMIINHIPGIDWGLNNEIIMGSVMYQQLNLGKMRLTQNYVFDAGGNLRNSQLTIQLGDN